MLHWRSEADTRVTRYGRLRLRQGLGFCRRTRCAVDRQQNKNPSLRVDPASARRTVSLEPWLFHGPCSFSSTGYMPIVEFHTNDRFVHFQDWLGNSIAGSKNVPAIVLYDPANPAVAMIDRPVWNWIPWAPIFAVGLLLVLSAMNGFFKSRRTVETS